MRTPECQSKKTIPLLHNMEAYYDIPYEVPKRINASIPDLVRKSTIHTFQVKDKELERDGKWLFPIPHHQDAYWTNLKYVCHGIEESLEIGIVALTEDGTWMDILATQPKPQSTWFDTKWPIPSLPLDMGRLYISIKPIENTTDMQYLRIKILGFTDLFPMSSYVFIDENLDPYLLFVNGRDETFTTIQQPSEENYQSLKILCNYIHKIRLIEDYE
jgi:hypothetical protein